MYDEVECPNCGYSLCLARTDKKSQADNENRTILREYVCKNCEKTSWISDEDYFDQIQAALDEQESDW